MANSMTISELECRRSIISGALLYHYARWRNYRFERDLNEARYWLKQGVSLNGR